MDDTELLVVAKDCRDRILGEGNSAGMCATVSMALCGYLSAFHDLQTTVIMANLSDNPKSPCYDHVWLRLEDGRALDATYDQFDGDDRPAVYLGSPTEFHGVT